MICPPCAAGADFTHADAIPGAAHTLAVGMHRRCTGCECQHRVLAVDGIAARRAARKAAGGPGGLAGMLLASVAA